MKGHLIDPIDAHKIQTASREELYAANCLQFNYNGALVKLFCTAQTKEGSNAMYEMLEETVLRKSREPMPTREDQLINELQDFLNQRKKRHGKRGRYKVGHIPHMRVNPKSIRNKIQSGRSNGTYSGGIKAFRARPNDQGLLEVRTDGLPIG